MKLTRNLPLTPYVLTVGLAILARGLQDKEVPIKTILAAIVYAGILMLLVEVNEDLTVSIAWVACITSVLVNGQIVLEKTGVHP